MAKVTVFVGTVYGGAHALSEQLIAKINSRGHEAEISPEYSVDVIRGSEILLCVTSTTGKGEIPDDLAPLIAQLQCQQPLLSSKLFAVIALGDSSYGETFCGAGRTVDGVFEQLSAKRIVPRLEIDACEYFEPDQPALVWLDTFLQRLTSLGVKS